MRSGYRSGTRSGMCVFSEKSIDSGNKSNKWRNSDGSAETQNRAGASGQTQVPSCPQRAKCYQVPQLRSPVTGAQGVSGLRIL